MNQTMNYTYIAADGTEKKIVGIDVRAAKALQKQYGLTAKLSMIEWAHRNGKMTDEEYAEFGIDLTEATAAPKAKRKAPARKVDVDKKTIVTSLYEYLASGQIDDALGRAVEGIVVENEQRLITFMVGDDTYSLTLARKRKTK